MSIYYGWIMTIWRIIQRIRSFLDVITTPTTPGTDTITRLMKTSYDPWILQDRSIAGEFSKKIPAMIAKGPSICKCEKCKNGFQCEKLPQCITLPKRAEHVGNKSGCNDFSLLIAGYIFLCHCHCTWGIISIHLLGTWGIPSPKWIDTKLNPCLSTGYL